MGIIRNFTDGNMQALRSLNSSVVGAVSPYVDNTLNALNGAAPPLPDAVTRRVDDLTRITKLLVDKPGIKFLGNQLLLSKAEIERKIKAAAQKKRDAGGTGAGQLISGLAAGVGAAAGIVLKVGASTLAQVPVNGTGTHFLRGFKTDTYLQPAADPNNPDSGPGAFAQFFGAGGIEGAPLALEGSPIILDGGPQTGLSVFSIPNSSTEDARKSISLINENNPKRLGLGDVLKNKLFPTGNYLQINGARIGSQEGLTIISDNDGREGFTPLAKTKLLNSVSKFGSLTSNKFNPSTTVEESGLGGLSFYQNNDYIQFLGSVRELKKAGRGTIGFENDGNVKSPFKPLAESRLFNRNSKFASRIVSNNVDTFTYLGVSQAKKTDEIENPLFTDVERTTSLLDFRELKGKGYRSQGFSLAYENRTVDKTTRVGLGNPGKKRDKRIKYSAEYDSDTVDKINYLDVRTSIQGKYEAGQIPEINENGSRDLIRFEFEILTPDETYYLPFRAFLTQFDDNFNASWNSTKYLGRADNFYTYAGFDRSMSIGFKIAAQSRAEMRPLYRKIATLASVTAPTYGTGGRFMRGSIAKVTIGDYIFEQPGIIDSVSYAWQTDYPWEINMQGPESGEGLEGKNPQVLPHVLDVSLSFKLIHDFLPETGITPFITNHNAKASGKDTYVELTPREFVIPKTTAEIKAEKEAEEAKKKEEAEKAEREAREKAEAEARALAAAEADRNLLETGAAGPLQTPDTSYTPAPLLPRNPENPNTVVTTTVAPPVSTDLEGPPSQIPNF